MSRFGEKLKIQRERLQIGQEELAKLCGVSRRTIVSYETEGKQPRQSTLNKLCKALGTTEYYLLHDDCDLYTEGLEEQPFVQAARKQFGKKGAEEMAELLMKNEALFAGGALSEDQKDMFYEAVSRAYFMNKQAAREKYGRKKKKDI